MPHILVYCYGRTLVGFALKKLIKLAAIVFGFFRVDLAYLSYKGWVDVKWFAIENATKHCYNLIKIANQAVHAFNNTASHFQARPAAIGSIGLPVAAAFGFMPRLVFCISGNSTNTTKSVATGILKISGFVRRGDCHNVWPHHCPELYSRHNGRKRSRN